jgi:hypothetical protein
MSESSSQADVYCGAKAKSTGLPCKRFAGPNGRCKLHGGRSTGPKTAEGKRRSAMRWLKHGERSAEALAQRRAERELLKIARGYLDS